MTVNKRGCFIVTCYGLVCPEFEYHQGLEIILFAENHASCGVQYAFCLFGAEVLTRG